MDLLPDLVLLEIFENLDLLDLCACSRVCWRWYAVTQSCRLKRSIVITKELNSSQVCSLIQYHCRQQLEVFRIYGSTISREALRQLSKRSPNLKKLVLEGCHLLDVSLVDVITTPQHLSFRRSILAPLFFDPLQNVHFGFLTCLDISRVWIYGYDYFLQISKLRDLRCLYLQRCFINDSLIPSLHDILPQLHVLDVEGTSLSNRGVRNIISYCTAIKELYIGHLDISDSALISFSVGTHLNLTILCIKRTSITPQRIQQFLKSRAKKVSVRYEFHPYRGLPTEGCGHYLSHSCPH